MIRRALSLFALFSGFSLAQAQIEVEIVLDQTHFLPREDLKVGVRIINRSGEILTLGHDNHWLKLSVEARDGFVVHRKGNVPVEGVFELESAMMGTRWLNVGPYFDMDTPGVYVVTAIVFIEDWNKQFTSKPATVNILQGTSIYKQKFGIPDTSQPGSPPVLREYLLQQAIYLEEIKLYMKLVEPEQDQVVRVFPLGRMVQFSRPEVQIDQNSNLHVLYQNGMRRFGYYQIDTDGFVVARRTYVIAGSRPTLRFNQEGQVLVVGGQRQRNEFDIPPEKETVEANAKGESGQSVKTTESDTQNPFTPPTEPVETGPQVQ